MTQKKCRIITIFLAAALLLLSAAAARANLSITPWRVVFGPRDRSAVVTVLNTTDSTNVYRMNWVLMKANAEGRYEPVADDGNPNSVTKMVIFSPRQVTVEPHAYQTVRLSLRRPSDLPPGEYRGHLTFTHMANEGPQDDPRLKGQAAALSANVGFSIPVIVRQGEDNDLKVLLSGPKLAMGKGNKPILGIDLSRVSGIFSTYGMFKVFWSPAGGQQHEIGTLNNVALYPEVKSRRIEVPLSENPASGTLRIVYLGQYESEGKTWAEKSFPIGG
jgi:fimbrial chaperone protein